MFWKVHYIDFQNRRRCVLFKNCRKQVDKLRLIVFDVVEKPKLKNHKFFEFFRKSRFSSGRCDLCCSDLCCIQRHDSSKNQ